VTDASTSLPAPPVQAFRVAIPLVVGCAFFMEGLDSTMIAVSLPSMAETLGSTALRLNLVITTYLLSLAVFIPVSGWIADRYGTRRVFCAAVLVFATGSALCGLSTSVPMLLSMRVVQGFGGAMMTPVGRLILLRSFPRAGLVSAMNWMTIPAMIGPTVGPIVGGLLTDYATWRWIFFLNIPIGVLGGLLALWLFEDYRAPSPTRFDVTGFVLVGLGLGLLEFGIENLGRPIVAPWAGYAFFAVSAAIFWLYGRHAKVTRSPVLDLDLFKIKTFRIGSLVGGMCRMGLDATPVLLPLLFQIGFGMSPVQSGFLSFSSTLGAMAVRTFSRTILRIAGFRKTLILGAILSAGTTSAFALLHAHTPTVIIVGAVLISGCIRSIQYLALNTISFAEVPAPLLSRSTSVSGVVQQVCRGFGVAIGAALLAIVAGSHSVTVADFRIVFPLVGLIPLLSVLGFLRLNESDGSEVSGYASRNQDSSASP
jgi:EmrB/QacA subfamily drug resistance transporter